METLDSRVRNVLNLVNRVAPLNIAENAEEQTRNTPETASTLRRLASEAIVLCKNDGNVLPLSRSKSTAIIGPNAKVAVYCGGGSAKLRPYYKITPFEAFSLRCADLKYALGCVAHKKTPLLSSSSLTPDGLEKGVQIRVYNEPPEKTNRLPVETIVLDSSDCFLDGWRNPHIQGNLYWMEMEAIVVSEIDGEYEFSLSVNGTAKLFVDGIEIIDNTTNQRPGDSFFGAGTAEELGFVPAKKEQILRVLVKFGTAPTSDRNAGSSQQGAGGLRVGCIRKTEPISLLREAVEVAKSVDQVVLCIGTSDEWESEGYDREDMELPPGTNDLVYAVCKANETVVVVNQSGTPVSMPWVCDTPAILQAWFGGNETGNAIADVVFGNVNPSGKMPLTWPRRVEDNPAYFNSKSDNGKIHYGEDVYIGYRFYEKTGTEVLFPFGHGLSYSSFELKNLTVKIDDADEEIEISVSVRNTGSVAGAEVIQVYVTEETPTVQRPLQELKGFSKVNLQPSETKEVAITIPAKYATSYWYEEVDKWVMEKGNYIINVRTSSASMQSLTQSFKISRTAFWKGL
jgi:beta-glucosidase